MKESESSALADSKSMGGELSDLRLQLERLRYDSKEAAITSDSLKDQNAELERELEELRVRFVSDHRSAVETDRDFSPTACARGRQVDAEVGRAGRQGQEEGGAHGGHAGRFRFGASSD